MTNANIARLLSSTDGRPRTRTVACGRQKCYCGGPPQVKNGAPFRPFKAMAFLSGFARAMEPPEKPNTAAPSDHWFATTHWSVIMVAAQNAAPGAQEALEKLCRTYWYPLYAYVRRRGCSPHDAQDLAQAFFARLLSRNFLDGVAREKGKFRSFLLAAMNHFLSDEWDKARAQKRGGGVTFISLDDDTGEERYRLEPVDGVDPEKLFERRWALTLLDQARQRLKEESAAAGQGELYKCLRALESGGENAPSYAQMAAELGLTESAVKSALFRMRQRYRELVREEVGNTVGDPLEIDEEIRYLITVVSA